MGCGWCQESESSTSEKKVKTPILLKTRSPLGKTELVKKYTQKTLQRLNSQSKSQDYFYFWFILSDLEPWNVNISSLLQEKLTQTIHQHNPVKKIQVRYSHWWLSIEVETLSAYQPILEN